MTKLKFHSIRGWTHQLDKAHKEVLQLRPEDAVRLIFPDPGGTATLLKDGSLIILEGFQWDGASGPTVDGPSTHRASLVHDALYRMLKRGAFSKVAVRLAVSDSMGEVHYSAPLSHEEIRKYADNLFYEYLIEDGMYKWRAAGWWLAVRLSPWAAARKYQRMNRWL